MKKIILLVTLVFLLFGLTIFAFVAKNTMIQVENGPYTVEVQIEKEWNIVAGTIPQDGILENSEIKIQDIKAMWYYSPLQKKYILVYPNTDWSSINQDDEDFVLTNAMWVYSKKSGKLIYSTLEDYPSLDSRKLYSGWNFVSITPDMIDKNLNDLKGGCDIEKFYMYAGEGDNNGWTYNLVNFLADKPLDDDWIGLGAVIKVTDNCNLGEEEAANPPGLPTGNDIIL